MTPHRASVEIDQLVPRDMAGRSVDVPRGRPLRAGLLCALGSSVVHAGIDIGHNAVSQQGGRSPSQVLMGYLPDEW